MGCACEALLLSRGSVHDVSVSWSQVPLWCQVCLGLTSSSEGSKNRVRSWALKAQEGQRAFAGSPQGDDYRLGGRFGGTSWCNQKMLSLVQPLPIRKIRPQGSGSVSSTRDTGGVNSAGAQQLAAWRPLCPCSSAWAAAPPTYLPRAPRGLWCITPHRDGALPFHPNTVGGRLSLQPGTMYGGGLHLTGRGADQLRLQKISGNDAAAPAGTRVAAHRQELRVGGLAWSQPPARCGKARGRNSCHDPGEVTGGDQGTCKVEPPLSSARLPPSRGRRMSLS